MPQPGIAWRYGSVPNVALALSKVRNFTAAPPVVGDQDFTISGQTLDSTGATKASATVYLFEMRTNVLGTYFPYYIGQTVSDASGNYSFVVAQGPLYWIADYKTGAPDVAGATLQTLTGV
jgi:hypothetical protein